MTTSRDIKRPKSNINLIWIVYSCSPFIFAMVGYIISEYGTRTSETYESMRSTLISISFITLLLVVAFVPKFVKIERPYGKDFGKTTIILAFFEMPSIIAFVSIFLNTSFFWIEYVLVLLPIPFSFYFVFSWMRMQEDG